MKLNIHEAWVTFRALDLGVEKMNGSTRDRQGKLTFVPDVPRSTGPYFYWPGDWHATEAEAVTKFRKMIATEKRALVRRHKALDVILTNLSAGKLPMRDDR